MPPPYMRRRNDILAVHNVENKLKELLMLKGAQLDYSKGYCTITTFHRMCGVVRPDISLVYSPNGMWREAAGRRTKRFQRSGVVNSRRPTHHRAEPVRERPLSFHLVQVPAVSVDALERVNPERETRRLNLLGKSNSCASSG